jgi:hypothetical protein
MRTALVLAIVLIFAGTAHAQFSGRSINSGGGSINGSPGLNSHASTSTSSASQVNSDASVNQNSKNPGAFVPSTFSSYQDALAIAKLQAALRPVTVAEAAHRAQEQNRKASGKAVIQLEEDEHGKLLIASAKKQ